eukprot:TRINITY_DN10704_c0_g1_i1.p1 TRINITY_DN10704_c0_g1~~TRINITY_DN10704_c0_g1_i1.p1  ORF type:complete len:163 (+),score=19.42 TRINITY_DN10704_c0_g1_i1:70-558(+)
MQKIVILMLLIATLFALFQQGSTATVCATNTNIHISDSKNASLTNFAKKLGVTYVKAFVNTAAYIQQYGYLPNCYLTKHQAQSKGWKPGKNLWNVAPGDSIGGDAFGNHEGKLPPSHLYIELDLDYAGGHRGAHRMVYAKDATSSWKQWVSVDHYSSFHKVP